MTERQREQLSEPIAEVFRSRFRREDDGDLNEQLRLVVGRYVDATTLRAFDEIFAAGYRPLSGED